MYKKKHILILALVLLPVSAFAVTGFASMMIHLQDELKPVWTMLVAFARFIGLWFGFMAVYKLKVYGRMTAFMSQNASLLKPMTYLLVGVSLWYLPDLIDKSVETIWGYDYDSIKSYQIGEGTPWDALVMPMTLLIRVIGLIAFLRGWILIVRSTNEGVQPGTFGKGFMHIIGGVLAINILGTINVLKNSLGF